MKRFKLQIAGVSAAVHTEDDAVFSHISEDLQAFACDSADYDLNLTINRVASLPASAPEGYLLITLPGKARLFIRHTTEGCEVSIDVLVRADDIARDSMIHALLVNQMLTLLLQHARYRENRLLSCMHSCGCASNGAAFLLAGQSGCGKSTAARSMLGTPGLELLADDLVLLSYTEDGWFAHSSPLGGEIGHRLLKNVSAPLAGIFFLVHGKRTGAEAIGKSEAAAAILSSLAPLRSLNGGADTGYLTQYSHDSLEDLMDESVLLASEVPCFRLDLELGWSHWEEIFDMEGLCR